MGGGGGGVDVKDPGPAPPPPPSCNKHHHRTRPALKGLPVNQKKKWPRSCAWLDAGVAHGCARLAVKMAHGCAQLAVKMAHGCARLAVKMAHGCAQLAVKMAHGCARRGPTLAHGYNHVSGANRAPGLSLFHCSVSGTHRPDASKRTPHTGGGGTLPSSTFWALGCPLVGSRP